MNTRIIAIWAAIVVSGLFLTTVLVAAETGKNPTPKPAVSGAR
jgi:hypothetical protein